MKIFKVSCSSKLYRTRISSFSIKDTKFTIAITNCFCIIISTLLTYTYLLKLPSNVPKNVINNQFIWDKSMRYKTLLSIRKIVISYKYTFCKFTFWFSYIQLISKFLLQRKKFSKTFCTYLTKWKVLLFCNTTKMIRKITLNLIQQQISIKTENTLSMFLKSVT